MGFSAFAMAASTRVGNSLGAGSASGARLAALGAALAAPVIWIFVAFVLTWPPSQAALLSLFTNGTDEVLLQRMRSLLYLVVVLELFDGGWGGWVSRVLPAALGVVRQSAAAGGRTLGGPLLAATDRRAGGSQGFAAAVASLVAGSQPTALPLPCRPPPRPAAHAGAQTILSGIIGGVGKQKRGSLINVLAYWLCAVPVACLLGFWAKQVREWGRRRDEAAACLVRGQSLAAAGPDVASVHAHAFAIDHHLAFPCDLPPCAGRCRVLLRHVPGPRHPDLCLPGTNIAAALGRRGRRGDAACSGSDVAGMPRRVWVRARSRRTVPTAPFFHPSVPHVRW